MSWQRVSTFPWSARVSLPQRRLLLPDSLLGLSSPQQEFQGQEGEDVNLLKQGPKIDVRTHPLLDGATRAACNGEGKTMSLSLEGWVGLEDGMLENW